MGLTVKRRGKLKYYKAKAYKVTDKGQEDFLGNVIVEKHQALPIIGEENITDGQYSRADLNILVTVNTKSKTIYVTDLHRDMLVNYHGEKSKLSGLYAVHGMEASKEVVEDMAGISIDSTVKVNFQQFENVVDAIGGLEINLTKKEAGYLNKTNYIRDKKYRNVKEGVE